MSTALICQEARCPRRAVYFPDLKAWLCPWHAWHLYRARRTWRGDKRPAND